MYTTNLNYFKPKTISEASELLLINEKSAVIAGGTDLLVELKKGFREVEALVSLSDIKELKTVSEDLDNIYLGSGLTHFDLISSELIRSNIPALSDAASKIGSNQIRNTGTLGGNLCTAASCADTAPILLAYDSSVELESKNTKRVISLRKFMVSHHRTELKKDELLTKVIVPKKKKTNVSHFEKFGIRNALSISVATTAVLLCIEKNVCSEAHIVIGACAPTPIISNTANKIISEVSLHDLLNNQEIIEAAGSAASNDSIPIDDIRGSAVYRRHLVKILTVKSLSNALSQINSTN